MRWPRGGWRASRWPIYSAAASFTAAVSPAVLIPRPETEHLLEAALQALPADGSLWDLGTGSGIIAVSAKLERPDAAVRASDISADALAVARNNARTLGAAIEWALGSWFDAAVQDNSPFRLPVQTLPDPVRPDRFGWRCR